MCLFRTPKSPPPPPPLPPAPPPPQPPEAPNLPSAAPLEVDPETQVRRAESKKAKSGDKKGTGALRIPLKPSVNTGMTTPAGGLNK
tara:strand:+ start:204 stop:461 length:258 start_codon:yes stop_codon:yes gene_type:complete